MVDLSQKRQAAFDAEVTEHEYAAEATARSAVGRRGLDAAVVPASLVARSDPSTTLVSLLQSSSGTVRGTEALLRAGVDRAEISAALEPAPLPVSEVGEPASGSGIALIGSLLLYIAILTFGIVVATAVVVEKSSRVVEVVLSAIRPVQLLTGKVLGIGLLGLLQVLAVTGVGLVIAIAIGSIDLPSSTAETAILVGVYFVLGYLALRLRLRRRGLDRLPSGGPAVELGPALDPARRRVSGGDRDARRARRQPGDDLHLPAAGGADGRPRARRPGRAARLGAGGLDRADAGGDRRS